MSEQETNNRDDDALVDMVLTTYTNEPCRICGRTLTFEDVKHDVVFAGYSKCLKSRCAHGSCWRDKIPKEKWAFPEDDE